MEKREYKDHTISLMDDWRFKVEGPTASGNAHDAFSSLNAARDAIDARVDALAKQKKTEATMSVGMLDDNGLPVAVRGVHSGHGVLLGAGRSRFVYPNVPWLKEKLVLMGELERQVATLKKETAPFAISSRVTYGRIEADRYGEVVARLLKSIEDREAAAKAKA